MNPSTQRPPDISPETFPFRRLYPFSLPAPLRRADTWLILVCLLAALPTVYLALTQAMEYDGFWHIFVAQQDNWRNFWFDYKENNHPPLMYLLLKLLMPLGRSIFVYRIIPLLSCLVSIYLVGQISRQLSISKFTPVLTGLAFGLSISTIELSISVRSYMLSVVFVLLAFYYFLDLVSSPEPENSTRVRMLFVLSLMLAVSSHYMTFFYVAACGVILAGAALLRWSSRSRASWVADVLMFVPVAGMMAYFYFTHIRWHLIRAEDYLMAYSYDGHEPKLKFLLRNLQSAFNFLTPLSISNRETFLIVAAALALAGIALLIFVRSRAVLPLVMFLILLSELAWAGLQGKYPFGGPMRQQYILFPFAILSAGVAFDRCVAAIRGRWFAAALAAAAAVTILSVSYYRWEKYPKFGTQLFASEMESFHVAVPGAPAVLLDQFNLIAFFIHHHQWKWRFDKRLSMTTAVDQYTVEQAGSPFAVLRDRTRWNFDFTDPAFFRDVAGSMRAANLTSLAVFCLHQYPGTLTPAQQNALQQKVFQLAEAVHLGVRSFTLDRLNVYAQFERTTKQGIQVVSATYGANCGASADNATADFKDQCQDKNACDYVVDFAVLGDPKHGCRKNFKASWTCAENPEIHAALVPPEAGFKSNVAISCPDTK